MPPMPLYECRHRPCAASYGWCRHLTELTETKHGQHSVARMRLLVPPRIDSTAAHHPSHHQYGNYGLRGCLSVPLAFIPVYASRDVNRENFVKELRLLSCCGMPYPWLSALPSDYQSYSAVSARVVHFDDDD